MADWFIRPYAGTREDALELLEVEKRSFGECPYSAQELAARLARPEQRVWLAEAAGRVVGFLSGLETLGLGGPRLEADLLGVHPDWRGKGIATALLLALRRQADGRKSVRGVVSVHNPASARAFARAGFAPSEHACDLLLYRIRGRTPRALPAWGGAVRPLAQRIEADQLAAIARGDLLTTDRLLKGSQETGVTVLIAEKEAAIRSGMELLEVHTLLYSGLWIESILPSEAWGPALRAMVAAAIELAKARGLDEVGCLVPQDRWSLRATLLEEGFSPLDRYRMWQAHPLPTERASL
ncbi:MAG: GNAT family N-acetyltransferase [Anaerolineae bacterium]|nr:GNAT family N-acetyltransferase [Anaerolineae bacterium]